MPAYQAPLQPPPPPAKSGLPGWAIALIVIFAVAPVVLGIFAALAIYGVRKYVTAAKTAEAKAVVGAISRDAVAAYEREPFEREGSPGRAPSLAHALCKSAIPVPAVVPAGKKYLPSTAEGADYQTGNEKVGWRCLKFSMTAPTYYQYRYTQGSGYELPALGAGPEGFEIVAHGDLDANGVKATFARIGQIRNNNSVVLATELYIENEFE